MKNEMKIPKLSQIAEKNWNNIDIEEKTRKFGGSRRSVIELKRDEKIKFCWVI